MSATEQEYKNHIKELEQQVRLLKEQVDFLTRKLYGTKSEKTSTLEIEGQMSLFNEVHRSAGRTGKKSPSQQSTPYHR